MSATGKPAGVWLLPGWTVQVDDAGNRPSRDTIWMTEQAPTGTTEHGGQGEGAVLKAKPEEVKPEVKPAAKPAVKKASKPAK